MSTKRLLLVASGFLVLLAVIAIGTTEDSPLDPDGTGPDGARGLVLLLGSFAASVEVVDSTPLPAVETAVLLDDRLSNPARREIVDWVRDGGVLVVADPDSGFVPAPDEIEIGMTDGLVIEPGLCTVEALDAVGDLEIAGRVGYPISSRSDSCFGDGVSAFVVVTPLGDGLVVAVGGAGVWINSTLDRGDNAVLAVALLAPRPDEDVAVLRPQLSVAARPSGPVGDEEVEVRRDDVGGGDTDLFDLMPDYMRWVVLQLALAWVVYAVSRARRLGRPVSELQPVHIPGSEIVRASGRLLRAAAPSETSSVLCDSLRVDLARHLGLPTRVSVAVVAEVAAECSDLTSEAITAALDPTRAFDDATLVALSSQHDRIREEVMGVRAR